MAESGPSSKRSKLPTPSVGEKPHQPIHFNFPKRSFGKKTVVLRPFKPQWFSRWKWLHYAEDSDSVFCFTCVKAYAENKLFGSGSLETTYISTGYTNWKDACVKFPAHEQTRCHKDAVLKVFTLPATTRDVAESLSSQFAQERLDRRQCLLKLISNIRFLTRQGLALRGDGDEEDSNFMQLLKLRAEDDERVSTWIRKKTDKYTSSDMQNEIIKVMALQVLREVACGIQNAPHYTIMVDETSDVSNREQVVLCFRWVDSGFETHEDFVGLYMAESIDSVTIYSIIQDTMQRFNLSTTKIRGQCYDGAASMSGSKSGVATRLLQEESRAIYTHCYGHSLNLACADAIKKCSVMKNALDTTFEITKLIKKSPKRDIAFNRIKSAMASDSPGIAVLCPTRWTVRADALESILKNYNALQALWVESIDSAKVTDMKARIQGVASQMNMFSFFFGVNLGSLILCHSDNLSRTLQKVDISAAEGQEVVSMSVRTLQSLRSEAEFRLFWTKVSQTAEEIGVDKPCLPRQKKTTTHVADKEVPATPEEFYKQIYFEALDLIIAAISKRFDQPGFRVYRRLQDILLKAANGEDYNDELEFITNFYGDDLDRATLKAQLVIFSTTMMERKCDRKYALSDIITYFKECTPANQTLLSEVCTLMRLLLVMPATNATSERSFSTLRRIKSYLRSTMSQERVNHLMILHVYREITDQLDVIKVANSFISGHEHRQNIFGSFKSTDKC